MIMRNRTLNKLSLAALSLVTIMTFGSCKKYFLDAQPTQSISDQAVIVDSSTSLSALLGVYDGLQSSNYYGGDGYAAAAFLSAGDGLWVGTLNYYNTFITHTYRSDNTLLSNVWNDIYKTVNRANQVIDKVSRLDARLISTAARNQYVGEAYFIRALTFFDLARAWGNITIIQKPTTSPADVKGIKQSTQQQTYAQVLADLTKADSLLPNTVNRNRVTKKTVGAFLARLYLYTGQWELAEAAATRAIADPNYKLIDWNTFINNKATQESIFELQFTTADPSAHYGSWSSVNYRNQYCPSATLYNLEQDPATGGDRKALIRNISTPAITNYFVQQLYWRANGDNPTYIFRLAEQYLIRAEARAKKASPDLIGALADLNAVRVRANVAPAAFTQQADIIQAIENERRVEFALEPHRWFDLVRTGRAGTVLGVTDQNKWIFPIPFNDIQANPDLTQNLSY